MKGKLVKVNIRNIDQYERFDKLIARRLNHTIGEVVKVEDCKVTLRFIRTYIDNGKKFRDEVYQDFWKADVKVLSVPEIKEYRFKGQNNKPVNRN